MANELETHNCMAAWDLAQDVIDLDLGLGEGSDARALRADAYSYLRQREIAKARPYLLAGIEVWEEALERFRVGGRHQVQNRLDDYLSEDSLELTESDRRAVESEVWATVHDSLATDLRKMQADLAKVDRGLAEWGDVKPVSVHYREILKEVWADRIRILTVICLINIVLLAALRVLGLPMWIIVFPVLLSTVYYLGVVVIEYSEYGRLYFGCDRELQEYARGRRKGRSLHR